jgi:voltage-gated potassium channel Kch
MTSDFVVVGSGATGSVAAQTLVESGASVVMLDAGRHDTTYSSLIPTGNFVELRGTDSGQHRYLLGDNFESLASATVATGSQLTPPRRHVIDAVDRFLPIRSSDFTPLQSLALGGLGSAWGLGCCVYSREEMNAAGLPWREMEAAYQVIASRIGISGADDDVRPFTTADLRDIQPPLPIDKSAEYVLERYKKRRARLHARGFYMGRPALALLSQPKDGRSPSALGGMEFYSDEGRSAWRPWIAVEQLRSNSRFSYISNVFVTHFTETDDGVSVYCFDMQTLQQRILRCRCLILAAGVLATSRIVLRGFGKPSVRLPLLCNPYTYIPCIVPARLGKSMPAQDMSLAQLALFHDGGQNGLDIGMGFIYSYRALMLFRLLRETPLNTRDARILLQYLMSSLLIVGVHHPDGYSTDKYVTLEPDPESPTKDRLFISYRLNDGEEARVASRIREYVRALRVVGALAIKIVKPGHGASIHYAGTLPFSSKEERYTLATSGRLHGTKNIYVADGSGFKYLPAKGLTLSLMANSHIVARNALSSVVPR